MTNSKKKNTNLKKIKCMHFILKVHISALLLSHCFHDGFLLRSTYLRQSGGRYCSVGSLLCTGGVSCTCSCKARLPFAHPGCTGLPWKWWEISTLEMDKRKSVRRQNIFDVHSKGFFFFMYPLSLWTLFSLLFNCEVPIMFEILKIWVIYFHSSIFPNMYL